VSAEPEFSSIKIENGDTLILASDGLWEIMESTEVATFAGRYLDPQQASRDISREVANKCKVLGKKSDNLTIVIVIFNVVP